MGLSVNLQRLGKYLDQPALINKMHKQMPIVLSSVGAIYGVYDAAKEEKGKRAKTLVQNASILTFTVASALIATRGLTIKGKKIFEGLIEIPQIVEPKKIQVIKNLKKITPKIQKHAAKAPHVHSEHCGHNHGPFEELKKLSILGLIPVLGGILGGVVGDVLTKENWKRKFPDKVKEGSYQYLNNIFLCNVGAGIAMVTMNKLKVKNKAARFVAMLAGVVSVGLIAGSAIANFIGKNLINPLFSNNKAEKQNFAAMIKNLNSERRPEALDLSLHIDDIASVGFLTGFKWIGPVLPILYSVSAYRAGIGYRNGETKPN